MLHIRMLSGNEVASVPVEEGKDVKTLKQILNKLHGFPPRFRQRLSLLGNPLDDVVELDPSAEMVLDLVLLDFTSASEHDVRALINAAREDLASEVDSILCHPQDPNLASASGDKPLMVASVHGHTEVLRLLSWFIKAYNYLTTYAKAKQRLKDAHRATALSLSCIDGHADIVKVLLEAGADVNSIDEYSATALMRAATFDRAELCSLLLEAGANMDLVDRHGMTALGMATLKGHAEVVKVLLEGGSDVNTADQQGTTALMRACFCGHETVVRLLLEAGATVGNRPLAFACAQGHGSIVRLLLEANAAKADRLSSAHALVSAAHGGHTGIVRYLLAARTVTTGIAEVAPLQCALSEAATFGQAEVVKALLEACADLDYVDISGWTALMQASLYSRLDVVRLLLQEGAEANVVDEDGTTALMLASMTGHAEVVEVLIKSGADRTLVSKEGKTAFMEASSWGHETEEDDQASSAALRALRTVVLLQPR
eukprot:s742_g14.t2